MPKISKTNSPPFQVLRVAGRARQFGNLSYYAQLCLALGRENINNNSAIYIAAKFLNKITKN